MTYELFVTLSQYYSVIAGCVLIWLTIDSPADLPEVIVTCFLWPILFLIFVVKETVSQIGQELFRKH